MNASAEKQNRVRMSGAREGEDFDQAQYLTFVVGGETFAIGILGIKEIIEYAGITTVPMMPECIRGVINLRGAVVPVLDLSARFGRKVSPVTKRTCIIIVEVEAEGERQDMGVIVDAVNAVVEIPDSEIEPAPAFGARIRTDFIAGMGKLDGRFVILLDTAQVLSPSEIGAQTHLDAAGPVEQDVAEDEDEANTAA